MRSSNPLLYRLSKFFSKTFEKFGKLFSTIFNVQSKRVHFSQEDNLWFVSQGNLKWFLQDLRGLTVMKKD